MIGVIIKNSGNVVDKQVFSGDENRSISMINMFAQNHPSLVIEVHRDTDPDWATAFEQVSITKTVTPEQTAWAAAKAAGAVAALAFIAKKLGLE